MPSTIPSLALVGLVLTCSLAVLGQTKTDKEGAPIAQIGTDDHDPCPLITNCSGCVVTKVNTSVAEAGNGTCVWEVTRTGQQCVKVFLPSEGIITSIFTVEGCRNITPSPTPAPVPGPNTTTTTPPTTTPPTNGTTTTTPVPPTNATTTTPPTTRPTNSTTTTQPTPTTTTTPTPSNSTTTAAPPPKPAPAKGGFWAPFIGGIVFAVAVASLAYLIWRFYKVRLDRNYHTLSTNLI